MITGRRACCDRLVRQDECVTSPSLIVAVRDLWAQLAEAPGAFGDGATVVVSPGSRTCPPGYVGIVNIEGGALITAPDAVLAAALRSYAEGRAPDVLADATALARVFVVLDVLGPARLAYLSRDLFRPQAPAPSSDVLATGHAELGGLLAATGPEDAEESGLPEATSPVFIERGDDGEVTAASAYRTWLGTTAHLGVLTAPAARGRGAAGRTGSAAAAHALDHGLLPQWRARVAPSVRVARRLGFTDLGAQLSVRLGPRDRDTPSGPL